MYKNISLILMSLIFATTGQVSLKQAMNHIGSFHFNGLQSFSGFLQKVIGSPAVWLGFALYATAGFIWLIVLSRENLSFVYPFAGLTFIFVLIASKFFLKEPLGIGKIIGSLIIIAGIIITSRL